MIAEEFSDVDGIEWVYRQSALAGRIKLVRTTPIPLTRPAVGLVVVVAAQVGDDIVVAQRRRGGGLGAVDRDFAPGEVNHITDWFGESVDLYGFFLEPADVVRDSKPQDSRS